MPPKAKTPRILQQDLTPPQQLEAGGIGSDPSPQDGALGSGIRAPHASRGKAGLEHQGVTQQKATSSSSCSPRPRLLPPCPPTPPWIQCSQWSECCRPREQQESLSPLCQDVVGLVFHQHLHAPHVRAPELQAILHPLDLLQVQHPGLHPGHVHPLVHLIDAALHQPH